MGWFKDRLKEANRSVIKAGKAGEKALHGAGKTGEKALHDAGKTGEKTLHDAGKTGEKALHDAGKTGEKALHDIGAESRRAGRNINHLSIATGHFLESQVQGIGDTLSDADKRIREGKFVDAIWHVATDPLRHAEAGAAAAVAESKLLNYIAAAGASVYGGPAGAAAYAAWFAYRQTGDLELALKAGVIAWATAQGAAMVNGLPTSPPDALARKTVASAALGGAAVAASGGDDEDVLKGFLQGAALAAARETYRAQTGLDPDGKAPSEPAVAKEDPVVRAKFGILVDKQGNPVLDAKGNTQVAITSMGREISHVGLATANPSAPVLSFSETSPAMQAIAKVPYMNAMAYFHDQWAAVAQMSGVAVPATIVPAVILTVSATDSPLVNTVTNEVRSSRRDGGK
jgi:hypothetical protein